MADYTAKLSLDTSEFLAGLRTADQTVEKQFKSVQTSVTKSMTKARASVGKVGKALEKDLSQTGAQAFKVVKEGAEAFGGQIGGAASMVDKFVKSLSAANTVGGALAGVAAGGALAVGGLAFAAVRAASAFIEAADAAERYIEEIATFGVSTAPAAARSIRDFNNAVEVGSIASKQLAIVLTSELAGALTTTANLVARTALATTDLIEQFDGALEVGTALAFEMGKLSSTGFLGATLAIGALDVATSGYADEVDRLTAAVQDQNLAIDINKRSMFDILDISEAVTTVRRTGAQALREETEAARAAAKAERELRKEQRERDKETRAIFAQALLESKLRAEVRQEQRDFAVEFEATNAAAADSMQALNGQIGKLARDIRMGVVGAVANLGAEWSQVSDQMISGLSNINQMMTANLQDELEQVQTVQENRRNAGLAESKVLQEREAELKKALVRQFKMEKGLSIAEATINGAVAATSALAVLPPLGPILSAAIAATTATQIALIKQQKPPSFPSGGMVGDRVDGDHMMIAAERNEGILTPRGVASAGGPAGVSALNAGMMAGPSVVEIHLPGGVVASAMSKDRNVQRAVIRIVESELRKRGV